MYGHYEIQWTFYYSSEIDVFFHKAGHRTY
jgi:hypothetical protein